MIDTSQGPTLTLCPAGNFLSEEEPGNAPVNEKKRSVTLQEAEILKRFAKDKYVLEVGTGLGVSTRTMAEAAKHITSVDIDPWTHSFSFPDNVTLVKAIPDEHFEMAFIDGSHEKEAVVIDVTESSADFYILHDCYNPGVQAAIEHLNLKELEKFNTTCDMRMFKK